MLKVITLLALGLLAIGFAAILYILSGFPGTAPTLSLSSRDLNEALRINQLQDQIDRLRAERASKAHAPGARSSDYLEGFRQHEELLAEARDELRVIQQRLKESDDALKTANETETRVRESATAFLTLFAIIAAGLVGQAYFQIQGWDDRAKKVVLDVETVKPDLESIRDTRQSLKDELPAFLQEAWQKLLIVEDPGAAIQQHEVSLIEEIDHFTYLSTHRRFQKSRTESQSREYMSGILVAARGQMARRAYWEALSRLDEFFRAAVLCPEAATSENQARAYSYRALVSYQLMRTFTADRSWVRELRAQQLLERRDAALSDIQRSHEFDADWDHAYFVEALVFSNFAVPENVRDPRVQLQMYMEGQRRSVSLYEKLIANNARQYRACHQNLACCLKRIAQRTGAASDYGLFKQALGGFPSDLDLYKRFAVSGDRRSEVHFLWQKMISDPELFRSLSPIHLADYNSFWIDLLDRKVTNRDWRNDLRELQAAGPEMARWESRLV